MAGRNQHYVPQFLQRGFVCRNKGKNYYTWLYRKQSGSRETNIRNVGAQRDFYSLDRDQSLDDRITDQETQIGLTLSRIRETGVISEADKPMLIMTLLQFELRTNQLRQSLGSTFREFMFKALEQVFRPNRTAGMFIDSELASDDSQLPNAIKPLRQHMDESSIRNWLISTMPAFAELMTSTMTPKFLRDCFKKGHLKALTLDTVSPEKQTILLDLNYTVCSYVDLPLGDSIVLYQVEGDRRYKPFLEAKDTLKSVLLPLSSTQLVVGSNSEFVAFDSSEIREAIVACSWEFFIAARNTATYERLIPTIGTNSMFMSDEDIQSEIDRLIRRFGSG